MAQDNVLRFSYWTEASPPFVIMDESAEKTPVRGVLKDLAEEISVGLGKEMSLIHLPVQRIELQLNSGDIDIDCITQPAWKNHPEELHWSPVLFQGADRFLVRRESQKAFKSFADLKGKNLGVYNGYVYHQRVMEMIKNGEVQAVKVADIDHAVQLLLLNRIDALIDFDVLLNYKISSGYEDLLALADLIAEEYELFCAYSKHIKVDVGAVDRVIEELAVSGKINEIINRY